MQGELPSPREPDKPDATHPGLSDPERWVDEHGDYLFKYAMIRLRDPAKAEDAVQETLLAVHLKRHTWDETQPIGPWIGAITRYKLIDLARKCGRRKEIKLDETFELAAPELEESSLSDHEVTRLLDTVSETQREIVRSISIKGVSIREVATTMNMTEGAVRVTLHRGLKALAEAYRRLEL